MILTIDLTVLGLLFVIRQRVSRNKKLRNCAALAVQAATGLPVGAIAECQELIRLCVALSGNDDDRTTKSWAEFLARLDPGSENFYVPIGPPEHRAAHVVALLTDMPARWLFDCATNRRGTIRPQ